MKNLLDDIAAGSALHPAGEYAFTLKPRTVTRFPDDLRAGVDGRGQAGPVGNMPKTCGVRFVVTTDAGEAEVRLVLGGQYPSLVRRDVAVLRAWQEAVGADLSPARIRQDCVRMVAALAVDSAGKVVVGEFTHDVRKDGVMALRLAGVRLGEAIVAVESGEGAADEAENSEPSVYVDAEDEGGADEN